MPSDAQAPPGFTLEPPAPPPPGFTLEPTPPPGFTLEQQQAAPQWTRDNPLVPKTQEDIDNAPAGAWIKGPSSDTNPTGLMQKPAPETPVDQATQAPLNFGSLTPAMRDTGILGAGVAGLVAAGKGVQQTAQAVGGGRPAVSDDELLAAQPMHWGDFLHPGTLARKFLYQFAESAPTTASAIFGGALGTAAGGGPETPIGWATGIAGTAAGAALGSTLQSLGTNFGQALHETNGDGEKAWSLALKRTGIEAAGSAAGFSAFSIAPFAGAVKNTLFQAFGVQPAVAAGQRAAENIAEGKPAGEGIAETIPGAIIGTAAPLAAHEGIRRFVGHGAPPPPETAAPGNAPAAPAVPPPTPGETFGINLGNGVEPVTVDRVEGDVAYLKDAQGNEHPHTLDDVARLRTEAPNAAEAPEAAPAQGAQGAAGAEGAPPAFQEDTLTDLLGETPARTPVEQSDAELRAALAEEQPTGAQALAGRLAADQAETSQRLLPAPERTYGPGFTMEPQRPSPPEAQARDLIAQRGEGKTVSTGWLMSQLKLPREAADALLQQFEQEGMVGPLLGNKQRRILAAEPPAQGMPFRPNAPAEAPPQFEEPQPEPTTGETQTPAEALNDALDRINDLSLENAAPEGGGTQFQRLAGGMQERGEGLEAERRQAATNPVVSLQPEPRPFVEHQAPAGVPAVPHAPVPAEQGPAFERPAETVPATEPEPVTNEPPRAAPEGSRVPVEGEHFITQTRPEAEREKPGPLGPISVPPVEAAPPQAAAAAANAPRVVEGVHTKTGQPIITVQLPEQVDRAEYQRLLRAAKDEGGYYSKFTRGFIFKTRDAAERFAAGIGERPAAGEPAPSAAEASAAERPAIDRVREWINGMAQGNTVSTGFAMSKLGLSRADANEALGALEREGVLGPENPRTKQRRIEPKYEASKGAVDIGPGAADLIPEYRKAFADYAAAGHAVHVSRIRGELRVALDGKPAQTPAGAAADVGFSFASAQETAPPVPRGTDADVPEHPGLVIKSLETGKTSVVQPRGTRPVSEWQEIGKNHIGQTLYEDQRGVRSFVENGIRHTEPVSLRPTRGGVEIGVDRTDRPEYQIAESHPANPREVEYKPPAPAPGTVEEMQGWSPPSGMSPEEWNLRLEVARASEETETNPSPDKHNPQIRLAAQVENALSDGKRLRPADLQQLGEDAYGGKMAEGKFTRAELYDALELGVNRYITARPDIFDPRADLRSAKQIVRELVELKDSLPTQTVRAGEKESMQQFSTPPDYAYAAAWAANLQPEDRVLEPSAGTGSIVAPVMNAKPREVMVNELSANRAPLVESLGPNRAFRENAEQLNNILPADARPTVVVMNPPFSQTAGRMGNRMIAGTGARHVEQALARLAPGGRLVAIVGRGMRAYGSPGAIRFGEGTGAAFRDWWRRIGQEYDVRANVGVSGNVYGKYGTTFGTQLLVIDKNPPSGRAPVFGDVASVSDLLGHLEGVRNDRTAPTEQLAAQPGRQEAPGGGGGEAGPEPPVPHPTPSAGFRDRPADTGAGAKLPPGTGTRGRPVAEPQPEPGAGNALAPQQSERGEPVGTERQPPGGVGERPDLAGSGAEPDAMVLRPEGERGSVLQAGADAITEAGPGPELVRVQEAAANPETAGPITENVYEPYRPQRITIAGAQEHPTKLVQSAAMASVMPPDIDYKPRLPQALIKGGKLSDAQLEAITYAGHAHSQTLPEVPGRGDQAPVTYRRGYFIGDGTGVGKGAQVAGIILDNLLQGRKRALWLSESRTLINDARRDWKWLGRNDKEIFDVGKTAKPGADIKMGQGIGFLTYDTLKGYERQGKDPKTGETLKGQTRVDQLVNWLGKDFDGVIAFDESHNLANSIQVKGTRGIKDAAAKALAGIELQQKLPNARVVYVSATGATEVMNLAYAERLGLWGPGTAFPNKNDFISKISSGGVAAMELVARDMKAMGHYISRNLSFDGVEYDRVEHALTPDQHAIYDGLADGWQSVLQNIEEALIKTGTPDHDTGEPKADSRQRTNALSAFWSAHQRFFNQIITSMQMPTIIRSIEQDLKEGRQAVLQLVNTNEASQERAITRARAEEGDLEDLDMTPRDQLMQMIDKSFPTQQMEEYVDENGNYRTRGVVNSAGNIVHNPEALAMKERLLSKVGSLRVPDGPLEMLINHFGIDEVAEITGRKQRVVRKVDDDGQMRNVIEARPGSSNVTEAEAFQNAKKRILVFSQAGMTGRSYHADLSSPSANARRSHYLVQAGWRADKAIQGFGRTHRTNQASAPIFHLVTTDLQGQRRFISSIARRLAQLGALTKGERRAGESGMFSARDNLESNEARSALGALWRDIQHNNIRTINPADFEKQTGLKLRDGNGNDSEPPQITQFLNRLLSLKFDMQNHVFGEFEDRLNTAVERAAADGSLDVGTETLRADRISKEEDRVVHTDPQSGAETRYVRLKVENKSNPRSFDSVVNQYRAREPAFFVTSKRSGKTLAVVPSNNVTDADTGRIIPMYRLIDPMRYDFTERNKIDGYGADRYWERVEDEDEARRRWDEQVAQIPEYVARDTHLVTGAILPIWDRLGEGQTQVYRLQTDVGEKMLGRVIPDRSVDGVLKALGAESSGRQYTPAQVAEQVMSGGHATLANGWTLRRSTVANEPRIELTGPNYTHEAELRNAGVFSERIGYTTRYFVPTGERASSALEAIMERRPVVEMQRAAGGLYEERPGYAEPQITSTQSVDRLDDLRQFAGDRSDMHQAARDYVLDRGQATGHEHLVAVEPSGKAEFASTTATPDKVGFSPELTARLATLGADLVLHHYHPADGSLSGADIAALARPGLHSVVAHGPTGSFSARLSDAAAGALRDRPPVEGEAVLSGLYNQARAIISARIRNFIASGTLTRDQGEKLLADMVNRSLAVAGIIDYQGSRELALLPALAKNAIRQAAQSVSRVGENLIPMKSVGDLDARVGRSTDAVQFDRTVEGFPSRDEGLAAGRPAGSNAGAPGGVGAPGAPVGGEAGGNAVAEGRGSVLGAAGPDQRSLPGERAPSGAGEPARPEGVPAGQSGGEAADRTAEPGAGAAARSERVADLEQTGSGGLAEERPDYRDAAERAIEDAVRSVIPRGPMRRVMDIFGVGPRSPGAGDYYFNAINKDWTTPMGLARLDPKRSGVKMAAEDARTDAHNQYLHGYNEGLRSWVGASAEDRNAVLAAAEVLTLEGRAVPPDGRAVIVRNNDFPLARLSKVGDNLDLRTPARIQMFGDLSRVMDKAWDDRIAAVAKLLGWQGKPSYADIAKAAESAQGLDKKRLERAAAIIASVEYQRRAAYLPLMRTGDYFLRVTPKVGTEGWNGEGFPPTKWFELIDSRSTWNKLVGGQQGGVSAKAQAAIAELRKTFPEDAYDLTHGHFFRKPDQIKDLPLPAVDKLMMLIGNDVRGEFGKHMQADAASEAYENVVNGILDQVAGELKESAREQIREARMAGPLHERKGTPGYDPDFAEAIGKYMNWSAWSVANLDHGEQIEHANLLVHGGYDSRGAFIAGHPDPQVRDFWRQYDQRHDSPPGRLDGALNLARQGAFHWALGANAASTVKIMLHGPLLGVPTLTTGLGATGRARAIGDYLAASAALLKGVRIGKDGLELDLHHGAQDAGERALLAHAEAIGLTHPHGMEELAAMTHQGENALTEQQRFNRRFLTIWASNISIADRLIRGAMLLGAYRTAKREGMDTINRVWQQDGVWRNAEKTPESFARFMVDRTAGRWGVDNRMGIARSTLGGMLTQFRSYELNYLSTMHQLMWRMGPEGKVSALMMLAGLGSMAGALGLPFVQDIENAYEWAHKLIAGVDPNLNERFLEYMKEDPLGLGGNVGKAALYGLQPFGIDLGGLGFGDIIGRNAQSPLDMFGAAASIFVGAPMKAHERQASGQSDLSAFAELMPTAIKNIVRAYGVLPEQGVRTLATGRVVEKPQDISAGEQGLTAAGFRSAESANAYREQERDYRLREAQTQQAQTLNRKIKGLMVSALQAQQTGDPGAAAQYRAQAIQIERSAPLGVRVSLKAIREAEMQALNPQAAAIRQAPRAIRPQVSQPIYTQP